MTDYEKMALEWIAGDDGYGGGKFTVADLAALLRRVADEQRERDAKIAEQMACHSIYDNPCNQEKQIAATIRIRLFHSLELRNG